MKKAKSQFYRLLMLMAVVVFALDVSAQATISGHVKDDTGEDVIGATIMEKGTSNGTVTDFDGKFKLECNEGATLIVTYIGYDPLEVKAKDGLDITLREDVAQLNEVLWWATVQWQRRKSQVPWCKSPRTSSTKARQATPWR